MTKLKTAKYVPTEYNSVFQDKLLYRLFEMEVDTDNTLRIIDTSIWNDRKPISVKHYECKEHDPANYDIHWKYLQQDISPTYWKQIEQWSCPPPAPHAFSRFDDLELEL